MMKTAQIAMCFLLTMLAGCQPSTPEKAALQGEVYYGEAISIEPEDTLYVTGTAYFAAAEGVEFAAPRSSVSSRKGGSESEQKLFVWLDQRVAERPKQWKREDGIRFPVGVGPIKHTPIEDKGRFTFENLEPGSYLVWFDWKFGEVRSGNPQNHRGPRNAVSTPFKMDIDEGKVVQREFLLNRSDIITY